MSGDTKTAVFKNQQDSPPSSIDADKNLELLSPNNSLAVRAFAVEYFRRLLIIDSLPPKDYSDDLLKGLIGCLNVEYGNMRRDAAWALTNCACSPHNVCFKIITYGGLEALAKCAATSSGETQDQACWAIGNLALDCELCQSLVRHSIALPTIIAVLNSESYKMSPYRRNTVWAISQIFRGGIHSLPSPYLRAVSPGLCRALYEEDAKLRTDAAWAIAHLVDALNPGQIEELYVASGAIIRLVELLDDNEASRGALRAIGNLIAGGDEQTQHVLDAGLLDYITESYPQMVIPSQRRELTWILSNVAAGSSRQIDLLFEYNNMVELLLDGFNCDDHRIRKEVGWTLANALTGASFARKRYICSTNLLSVIPEVLKMRTETDLVNRTIRALTSLTDRRPNYFYLLRKYRIMDEIRAIAAANNLATQVSTAEILDRERRYYRNGNFMPETFRFIR